MLHLLLELNKHTHPREGPGNWEKVVGGNFRELEGIQRAAENSGSSREFGQQEGIQGAGGNLSSSYSIPALFPWYSAL